MKLPFRPPSLAFYHRLNSRERVLLLLVGASLLFVVNLFLLSLLIRSWRDLSLQYAEKSQELTRESAFAEQKTSLWEPRSAWLKKTQPPLVNRNLAGSQLLDTIKGIAQSNQVIISSQTIATAAPGSASASGGAEYQPITVRVDTQSDWPGIVKFMAAIQKPDAFLVFDTANLRTEQSDPAKMRGEFIISKWFAPTGK